MWYYSLILALVQLHHTTIYLALIYVVCYNVLYSTPCLGDFGNYITVYAGYNEAGQYLNKFCESSPYKELIISGSYAYIKFNTHSKVNTKGLRGFSKIEFNVQGTFIDSDNDSFKKLNHFRYQRV